MNLIAAVFFSIGILPYYDVEREVPILKVPGLFDEATLDRTGLIPWSKTSERGIPIPATNTFNEAMIALREADAPRFALVRMVVSKCEDYGQADIARAYFESWLGSKSDRARAASLYGLLTLYDRIVYQGTDLSPSQLKPNRPYARIYQGFYSRIKEVRLLARSFPELLVAYLQAHQEMYFMTSEWPKIVKTEIAKEAPEFRLVLAEALLDRNGKESAQQAVELSTKFVSDQTVGWRAKILIGRSMALKGDYSGSMHMLTGALNNQSCSAFWRTKILAYGKSKSPDDLRVQRADSRLNHFVQSIQVFGIASVTESRFCANKQ